jgi:hypothetical protein
MPRLYLTAQVLVKHGRKEKVIGVADEGYICGSSELERGKESAKPASKNHDSGFCHLAAIVPEDQPFVPFCGLKRLRL